jgi:hypothetical protein
LARSRFARRIFGFLGTAALVAAAPTAGATPIEVSFAGTFSRLSGSPPVSIPFVGMLFYDADTPNTSSNPPVVWFEFAAGSAGIRIDAQGSSYQTDPTTAGMSASTIPTLVDENGNPVPPNDPDAIPASVFLWTSFESNLPSQVRLIQIEQLVLQQEPQLPDSPVALAASLVAAGVRIDAGAGVTLSGRIASAAPVPEPSSAALLCFGIALLAARCSARRRRGCLCPCAAYPASHRDQADESESEERGAGRLRNHVQRRAW